MWFSNVCLGYASWTGRCRIFCSDCYFCWGFGIFFGCCFLASSLRNFTLETAASDASNSCLSSSRGVDFSTAAHITKETHEFALQTSLSQLAFPWLPPPSRFFFVGWQHQANPKPKQSFGGTSHQPPLNKTWWLTQPPNSIRHSIC